MPELPEVETIRLSLAKNIIGLSISQIEIRNPKTFQGDSSLILNQPIVNIWRRGKGLGIDFENGYSLLFHLKMSGQIIFKPTKSYALKAKSFIGGHPTQDMLGGMPNKATRVIFTLKSQGSRVKSQGENKKQKISPRLLTLATSHLYFNDQRKFGWIKVANRESIKVDKFLSSLGPEPLEKGFTWEILKTNLLKHKKTPIKVALLDQSVVSGVGNIYACEACFNAKIDPRTKVGELTDQQFQALQKGVIQALKDGIKYGGSTKTHFVDSDGKKGLFLDHAKVYAREEKPCLVCKTKIEKIKLGGRGTFFCPNCQNSSP